MDGWLSFISGDGFSSIDVETSGYTKKELLVDGIRQARKDRFQKGLVMD